MQTSYPGDHHFPIPPARNRPPPSLDKFRLKDMPENGHAFRYPRSPEHHAWIIFNVDTLYHRPHTQLLSSSPCPPASACKFPRSVRRKTQHTYYRSLVLLSRAWTCLKERKRGEKGARGLECIQGVSAVAEHLEVSPAKIKSCVHCWYPLFFNPSRRLHLAPDFFPKFVRANHGDLAGG